MAKGQSRIDPDTYMPGSAEWKPRAGCGATRLGDRFPEPQHEDARNHHGDSAILHW